MKITARTLHRDLANFYLGLIVAFSLSGIFLNHRQSWYPSQYSVGEESIRIEPPPPGLAIDEVYVQSLVQTWQVKSGYRGYRVQEQKLRVRFADDTFEIDLKTGEGIHESFRKVPILAQMTQVHVDTNVAWIWYSDIFGAAMLVIATTGVLMQSGKQGFRQRGWKWALVGLIFPLIFLGFF